MSVAARFYVSAIEDHPGSSTAATVRLGAVCRGSHNSQWASATPAGQITMTIRNDLATAQFVAGKEYEVTFREVTPPRPGDGHEPRIYVNEAGWVSCGECGTYPSVPEGTPYGPTAKLPEGTLDWSAHEATYQP